MKIPRVNGYEIAEEVTKTHVFFYGGFFSQWVTSPFKCWETQITFNCAEQYMMWNKAMVFQDYIIADKILQTTDPAVQKQLGKLVKGFDREEWDRRKQRIVYKGSYYKYSQNPEFMRALRKTGNRTIVEASPTDTIWGIGLSTYDVDIYDESKWRGENLLGRILMQLRGDLRLTETRWMRIKRSLGM